MYPEGDRYTAPVWPSDAKDLDTKKHIGAKGIGAVPIVGPAVALANAVARACKFRPSRLPITPEQIRGQLTAAE